MCLSAFFSSLETGLLALGEVRIRKWQTDRTKNLNVWINEPASIITGILIGNNFVNIAFSTLFTLLVINFVRVYGLPGMTVEIISIICSSVIILIFGEILPKTYANTYPEKVVKIFYSIFLKYYKGVRLLIKICNKLSFSMINVAKLKREKLISRKEVHLAVQEIEGKGVIEEDSTSMLENVFDFSRKTASDIMVPRKMIRAIDLNWQKDKIIDKLLEYEFSRIPVYKETLENFMGVIYIKDVIRKLKDSKEINFGDILRTPYMTYPGRSCQRLLHELKKRRMYCAIVRSNKRIVGFITIEDLIEEIVGEIYDEYDYKYNLI